MANSSAVSPAVSASMGALWAPYWWMARIAFLRLMAYRMRYVTGIATYSIFIGAQYFVWKAVYAARTDDVVNGFDLQQLTTYFAIGFIARAAYFTNIDSDIGNRFKNGEVTIDLLRPINVHAYWLAQGAGETAFRILFFSLPMAVVVFPMFGVSPPTWDGVWQFPLLFLLAFWVNAEINFSTGIATFWLESNWGLMSFKRNLLMLASGLLVPLSFIEAWAGSTVVNILTALPFAWIGYYPTLAYVGQLPDFTTVVVWGLLWAVGLRLLNLWLWRLAARRLEIQGG
jgi:ABC-2 type transport system permease protein